MPGVRRSETFLPIPTKKSAPRVPDEIEIYRMMGWMVFFDNPARFLLYTFTLLNVSERRSSPFGMAFAGSAVAFVCCVLGLSGLANRYLLYAKRAADRAANPLVQASVELVSAWHCNYIGDWDRAMDRYVNATKMAWKVGDMRAWGSALWGNCLLSIHRGDLDASWEMADKLAAMGDDTGDRLHIRWGHLKKGMILARRCQMQEAENELGLALEMARDASDYQLLPQAAAELGICLLHQKRTDDAGVVLKEAMGIVDTTGLRGHHVAALLNAVAELRITEADREKGEQREQTLRRARRACKAARKGAKIYRGAAPQALRLTAECLWLGGREKRARRFWRQSLDAADGLGARYEYALTQLSIGDRAGDTTARKDGIALLRALSAGAEV